MVGWGKILVVGRGENKNRSLVGGNVGGAWSEKYKSKSVGENVGGWWSGKNNVVCWSGKNIGGWLGENIGGWLG